MLSEQDIEKIIERYAIGLESLAKLSKEYHIVYSVLRGLLSGKGIKIRNKTESLQKYVKYSNCVICGRQFRMRDKWDSTTNHHKKTCGDPDCLHTLRSQTSKGNWDDDRKKYMSELLTGRDTSGWNILQGDQKPNWRGGHTPSYYRHIAFDVYRMEQKCEIVGCNNLTCLCVHHKDGDRNNNSKENLEIRCKSHHTGEHSKGNRLWKKHMDKK
jgi:hypothetical protein